MEAPQLIDRLSPPRTLDGTVMEEGFEGARFQMIVYAPSESGLSDTKIPEDKLQSGRTPLWPSQA